MARLTATIRDQRKQLATGELARTALALFAERGFSATSIDEIAAAAGCSPRTFYRYFGTKEDVLFHDLPAMLARLAEALDAHLTAGLSPWEAVTESLVMLISRFDDDAGDELLATERMNLWLREPALRARYVQYVVEAEGVVADGLRRHPTTAGTPDDVALLIAVAATGAYRVTVFTHHPSREGLKLAKHLRLALAAVGAGLAGSSLAGPGHRHLNGTRAANGSS